MKPSSFVLFATVLVAACGDSSAPPSSDQVAAHPETLSTQTASNPAPEAVALDIGMFVTMAEDHIKTDNGDFMRVYRLPEPAASTVNLPGEGGAITSWKFSMEGKSSHLLFVTLANFNTVEKAATILDQVPTVNFLRTTAGISQQHRTACFGGQCVHLAGPCGLSTAAFNGVWDELINALDNPTLLRTHDQLCAQNPV